MKKFLYLFVVTSIFLSSCSKNCPIPEAQEEWLFVHTAESAQILNATTIVMPLVDDIFTFTDRPYRKSYHMTGQHYADLWTHKGENCFQDNPPNAVLTWFDGDESKEIEVVITHAVLDSTTITYTIWDDSGIITEDIVHPSLFVDGANLELKIGDKYAGGIIFWLDGNGGGLVAAPSDQAAAHWGCVGINIPFAAGTAIGKGYVNTFHIYQDCTEEGIAAQICIELNLGEYSDWWLPNKDELNAMYLNLHQQGLGGFANDYYWSSTEDDNYDAWGQSFHQGGGAQHFSNKANYFIVRAVRGF